jgi:hypothetical protein
VKSDIDTILRLYKISHSIPKSRINSNIDQLKQKIVNVPMIIDQEQYYTLIDNFLKYNDKSFLEELKKKLNNEVNHLSSIELTKLNYLPFPPRNLFLPKNLKYIKI